MQSTDWWLTLLILACNTPQHWSASCAIFLEPECTGSSIDHFPISPISSMAMWMQLMAMQMNIDQPPDMSLSLAKELSLGALENKSQQPYHQQKWNMSCFPRLCKRHSGSEMYMMSWDCFKKICQQRSGVITRDLLLWRRTHNSTSTSNISLDAGTGCANLWKIGSLRSWVAM